MSVFVFSKEQLGRIYESLLRNHELRSIFEHFDQVDLEYLKLPGKTEREFVNNRIACFVDRCYIANQLAYCYTYNEPITVERIKDENDLKGYSLNAFELQAELRSLRYNICTNGGNTFLGVEDDKKLDALIFRAMSMALEPPIVRQLERRRSQGPHGGLRGRHNTDRHLQLESGTTLSGNA